MIAASERKDRAVLTVTQLNNYVKSYLDASPVLRNVSVRGEISNLKIHSSGHIYFTLKEQNTLLSAVMFASDAQRTNFRPENGMNVICTGRVAVYAQAGQYQLYVNSMEPDGVGALWIAYEMLKKKLGEEGLFDERYKKRIPKCPFRVGVVTSPTGAAVRDIIRIGTRRFKAAKIILFPALVQGTGAAASVAEGIEYFNSTDSADVLIVGRGGGSFEDLQAFNDERVARAVFASHIPIVSAVGHETDFTICDFVADARASTPSAAAELCFPDAEVFRKQLGNVVTRMSAIVQNNVLVRRQRVQQLAERRVLTSPFAALEDRRVGLMRLEERLESAFSYGIERKRTRLGVLEAKLPLLSPLAPLQRGYAVVMKDGKTVSGVKQLENGDKLTLMLRDGSAQVTTERIIPDEGTDE